ncbi:MAG: DUF3071 domain-containing protein [Propionibacteriaceae bacterium]|jgi:hypothetical protein|nr:DUF3071 domain-containing protein [Propionibacteriaceae bacterium]
MEMSLTPREIQTRIRAGESVDEVARVAGVASSAISAFASPVLAERSYATQQARGAQVRRSGEPMPHRTLDDVVSDRLASRGIDPTLVAWDAWRGLDRLWSIKASYKSGSATHDALFRFDPRGRYSVASNDDARWLLSESSASHGPQPLRGRAYAGNPDDEPTLDLQDKRGYGFYPTSVGSGLVGSGLRRPHVPGDARSTNTYSLTPAFDDLPDYMPGDLDLIDGRYEIVNTNPSMDVLTGMIASINEDSVSIYVGLTKPEDSEQLPLDVPADLPIPEQSDQLPEAADDLVDVEPQPAKTEPEPAPEKPAVPAKKGKRKRASVPSWDEIMFESPHPKN